MCVYLRSSKRYLENIGLSIYIEIYTYTHTHVFEQNLDEINKLDPKKASQTMDIPVPIIKGNKDAIALFLYHNSNNSLSSFSFPTGLRYAHVRPVFKKDDKTDKENYKPTSIPPII